MSLSPTSKAEGPSFAGKAISGPTSKEVAQGLQYYRDFCMHELEHLRRHSDQAWNLQVGADAASEENQEKLCLSSATFLSTSAESDNPALDGEKEQLQSHKRIKCVHDLAPYLHAFPSDSAIANSASEEYEEHICRSERANCLHDLPPYPNTFSSQSSEFDSSASNDEDDLLWPPERVNCIHDLTPYLNAIGPGILTPTSTRFSSRLTEIDSFASDNEGDQLWPQERVNCIADLTPYISNLGHQ